MLILLIEPPGVPADDIAALVLRHAPAELRSATVARDQFRRAGGDQFRRAEADQFRRAAIRAPDQFRRAGERSDNPSCHKIALTTLSGRYSEGLTRLVDLTDAQSTYVASRLQLVAAKFDRLVSRAALELAMGETPDGE